uniref:Small ribosomal subunit protein mS25 n=1 Tax=Strongyloides venezuelensis TaxID=75913 RepID=A0A0K0FQ24_STRVS
MGQWVCDYPLHSKNPKMPFMHGAMPLRRTRFYLRQGKVIFRDNVAVLTMGYHKRPKPEQSGTRDFIFWHWAQLQFLNPKVQLVKLPDVVITPFAKAYLHDGREVLFDLEGMKKEEIVDVLSKTLGKSDTVFRREHLEEMQLHNPASFGSNCKRQCMCEMQGQQPCTGLIEAPEQYKGKWRWNHNIL